MQDLTPDALVTNDLARHWQLEPGLAFLNHGSFGACPIRVLEAQQELRDELERQPVEFFVRRLPNRLDAAREKLAAFLEADPEGLVPNTPASSNSFRTLRMSMTPRLRMTYDRTGRRTSRGVWSNLRRRFSICSCS